MLCIWTSNFTCLPSFTRYITVMVIDTSFTILPTTCSWCVWLIIGSVLTWHMYLPPSDGPISLRVRVQAPSPWLTLTRWFLVMTWAAIVRIVCVSTRSHATWSSKSVSIHEEWNEYETLPVFFSLKVYFVVDTLFSLICSHE